MTPEELIEREAEWLTKFAQACCLCNRLHGNTLKGDCQECADDSVLTLNALLNGCGVRMISNSTVTGSRFGYFLPLPEAKEGK
jgi:hypothetical protein